MSIFSDLSDEQQAEIDRLTADNQRMQAELEEWAKLRDISERVVPDLNGDPVFLDPTPESVRGHLKYLQDEWDGAERRIVTERESTRQSERNRLQALYGEAHAEFTGTIAQVKVVFEQMDEVGEPDTEAYGKARDAVFELHEKYRKQTKS